MLKIIAVCLGSLLLGALMASGTVHWPLRPGYLCALLLIAGTWFVKRRWQQRRATAGDDPSVTERKAWLYMAGTALICGFVIMVLMTPGSEVHRTTGDTGGFDTWVMLGGGVGAWLMLHDPDGRRDERDLAFDAYANKVGYTALVVLLLIFLLALGFAPRNTMQRFTHWLIANSLLTIIMLAALAQYVAQLICYWRDARQIAQAETTAAQTAPRHD